MKKIIFLMIAALMFAANSSEDLNKKLDLILQKMNELEKKVEQKDREIEKLKKELKKQKKKENNNNKKIEEKLTLSNCKNIKASKFSYIYHDDVIPYYTLTYTLTNKYPKKIVHLKGDLIVEDKDDVKILQDYIDRDVNLAPGKSIVIKKVHTVTTDMEKELNGENPKNLKVVFEVIRADLADGSRIECGF
jgi:chromosome segregation ATPase